MTPFRRFGKRIRVGVKLALPLLLTNMQMIDTSIPVRKSVANSAGGFCSSFEIKILRTIEIFKNGLIIIFRIEIKLMHKF